MKQTKQSAMDTARDTPQDGVLILSIGSGRRQWLWNAVASVRRHRPDLGIHVLSDVPVDVPFTWCDAMTGQASRWYKTQSDRLSPFPGVTMIFDDDCVMHRPFPDMAELLGGADMAAKVEPGCPTVAKACRVGRHAWISTGEKSYTTKNAPGDTPHYNSGVLLFRKTPAIHALFGRWHQEWLRFQHIDQLALCRAIAACPVEVARLGEEHNYRSERRNRNTANPFVFHCHAKQDNDRWYHRRYAQPAEPHAAYLAFCRAVEHGQWDRRQYEVVSRLLHPMTPARVLVWGCGNDSDHWHHLNASSGGKTVFIETHDEWATKARLAGREVITWKPESQRGTPAADDAECPAPGGSVAWDAVIVDGPSGWRSNHPGRELPIRWAGEAFRANPDSLVAVHDIDRPWERWCVKQHFGPPSALIPGRNGLLGIWCKLPIARKLLL
jgi:hypothetical protein